MNILKARNELHEIVKNNPETQHLLMFDPNSITNEPYLLNTWKTQRQTKIIRTNHQPVHLYKDEINKNISEKTINQQKVEVKTPIFKNKKGEDFSCAQKQRFEKLGLENFIKEELIEQKLMSKQEEPIEQKIIKNLNNTYFRSTQHIHGKRKNMVNTLGIKRSSMSNYKVDWNEKDMDELEIEWKEIGYIPNKVFPCRKNSSVKNKIYTPKKQDSPRKPSHDPNQSKTIKDESLIEKANSMSFLQSKDLGAKNSFLNLNEKSNSLQSSRIMNKDKNGFLSESKEINRSQQFAKKPEISKILTIDRSFPTRGDKKRPWTSKESVMRNRKISQQLNFGQNSPRKRRYSETANKSFKSIRKSYKNGKSFNEKIPAVQQGSDFIKGNKMNINHAPQSRVVELF